MNEGGRSVRPSSSFPPPKLEGIYAIADDGFAGDLEWFTREVLAAGVRLVQYRAKRGIELELVRRLHALTRAAGALLIVNDDLDGALEADGLHVGQEDLERFGGGRLRERLGDRLLGISCGTAAEAVAVTALGADYLGTGPFRATASKDDAGVPIGEDGLRTVARATHLPVAAIGGIERSDLHSVRRAGARMAAIISALQRDGAVRANARALIQAWKLGTP